MASVISLVCATCSRRFDKPVGEYRRRIKSSPDQQFYCSMKCWGRSVKNTAHTRRLGEIYDDYLERAARVEDQMLANAEDALDSHVARTRLAQVGAGAIRLVSGSALDGRLAALMDE